MNDEPMMPQPKRIGSVRIKIGEKIPQWPVQKLHIPQNSKPVLPPLKNRSMTREEIEKCREGFYESVQGRYFPVKEITLYV